MVGDVATFWLIWVAVAQASPSAARTGNGLRTILTSAPRELLARRAASRHPSQRSRLCLPQGTRGVWVLLVGVLLVGVSLGEMPKEPRSLRPNWSSQQTRKRFIGNIRPLRVDGDGRARCNFHGRAIP